MMGRPKWTEEQEQVIELRDRIFLIIHHSQNYP